MTQNEPRVRVGTSGWKKPMWRGHFYRRGLVQNRELQYASSRLSSLEINTTFHGLPRASSYQNWRSETPDDFVFAVKGNKAVTHDHRLRNPADDVADFLASGVFELGEKLGPILWQTPPSLPFHHDTVEAFLATLPHSIEEARQLIARRGNDDLLALDIPERPIRHALEVRHPSFANPTFIELLRRYDVAAVVTNSPGWPSIQDVTSDFVYVRLHGSADHYPDGYDDATLDHWAGLVNGWLDGEGGPDRRGRDVFVYFDNPDNEGVNSPFDAMRLLERLGTPSYDASPADQLPLWEDEELLQQESHLTTMPGGLVPQTARFQGVSDLGRTLVKNRERVIELAGNAGAKNIRVFGSVAKGSDKAGSDALQHLEVLAFHLDQGGFKNQTLIDAICLRLAAVIDSISKTSPEFRERHFGSDWGAIRATRNRIVHGYAFINWDTIRSTIVNDLPAFRTELKKALV